MRFTALTKTARRAEKITQKQLAALMGVHVRTVQRWEESDQGKYISLDQYQQLCEILGVHIDGVHVGDDTVTYLDQDTTWNPKAIRALMFMWQDRMRKIGFKLDFTMHNEAGQDVTHGGY